MKKILTLAMMTITLAAGAQGAWANAVFPTDMTNGTFGPVGALTPNSNTGEFEIYDAINLLLGTNYTNNAQVDNLEYGNQSATDTWAPTGNGGYAVIGLGAGAVNSIEVYNAATPNILLNPLGGFTGDGSTGNGTIGSPYTGTGAVFPPGTKFGFDLNQNYNGVITNWYSNPLYNSDGMDHMIVYNLTALSGKQIYVFDPNTQTEELVTLNDPFLLGFEDLSLSNNGAGSDQDYNDLMVLVDGVVPVDSAPVPEPMSLALLVMGLLTMAGFALWRKRPIFRI